MSEINNTTVNTPDETTATQPERTFTQSELDAIVKDRLAREKGKYADYEELKSKAAKYDERTEAEKTELQKATERAAALEVELNGMKKAESIRTIREKVARETGIPAASLSLLTGETEEACTEQAKVILSMITPNGYPQVPDGGEVTKINKGSAREDFKMFASQFN